MQAIISTIKPTSGYFASFSPRAKEGEEKRSSVFASFELPAPIAALDSNSELARFAVGAFTQCVSDALRDALKAGKSNVSIPSLAECYIPAKKEYTIVKALLVDWLKDFAYPIIEQAIATKSGQSVDSIKVAKKAIKYRDLLLMIASREIMSQDEIDNAARVLELLHASKKEHAYTANVEEGLGIKQLKLNAKLAGQDDDDDEIDF